jgi:predicted transcriptional regulator of viral defense system
METEMTNNNKILKIIKKQGYINPKLIYRMYEKGLIKKIGRGLYTIENSTFSSHDSFALVSKKIPTAVISLISALSFHEITTQLPHTVWISLPQKSRTPKLDYPVLTITYISSQAYNFDIESHNISGVKVKIYSIAKTIADCFKFRNKVGLDVAIEALKDAVNYKKVTIDDLYKAAKVCRVWKIMEPYLEVLTS